MMRRTGILSIFAAVMVIAVLTVFSGCSNGDGSAKREISGVYALDAEVEYDGYGHGITVENLLDGDVVYYYNGSEWSTNRAEHTLPGQYEIRYRVERDGRDPFEDSATLTIRKAVLQGIGAEDARYIYDGEEHSISVKGVKSGDTVLYSDDGLTFVPQLTKRNVGEYTIFYLVERVGGEYRGSAVLTVVPDIRGKYINGEHGVITVTSSTLIVNDTEISMIYGVDGTGKTDACDEFGVEDGVLTLGGVEYIAATGNILRIAVGERYVYASGSTLTVRFSPDGCEIQVDGATAMTVADVNYVESASGTVIRSYTTSDVDITFTAVKEVTDVIIELSEREEQQTVDYNQTVVFDGQAHAPLIDGEVLYMVDDEYVTTPPEYTAVGRYVVRAVMLRDGYLPKPIDVIFEIVPDIAGIYYNDTTAIEITAAGCTINGVAAEMVYSSDAWYIDGQTAAVEDDVLSLGGERYERAGSLTLVVIIYNGVSAVVEMSDGYMEIVTDGLHMEIRDVSGTLYSLELVQTGEKVYVFGNEVASVEGKRVIGTNALRTHPVVIINIE